MAINMAEITHKDLIKAIKRNDVEKVSTILKQDGVGSMLNLRDKKGRQALHVACIKKRVKFLKDLLKNGADIHSACSRGYTPLHYACRAASISCIVVLLEMGADVHCCQSNQGQSALDMIPERKQAGLGTLLRNTIQHYEDLLNQVSELSTTSFLEQYIISNFELLCSEDIKINNDIVLAKGPATSYCLGTFRCMDVMVKYQNSSESDELILRDELMAIRKLGNHLNICQTIGVACENNLLQVVFESPGYGFLHRAIFQAKLALKPMEVLSIGRDVSNALRYIHNKGYLHCAVATFSVTLSKSLEAKICNFNYMQDKRHTASISHLPTVFPYMSRKQRQGHVCDEANDIYGLGVTLYESVTLRRIREFEEEMNKALNPKQEFKLKTRQIPPNYGSHVIQLIQSCMDPKEHKRPSADQIYSWIDAVIEGNGGNLFSMNVTKLETLQLT